MGWVLAHGRYLDGPRSQPPLAAEDNLNPEGAEEGLYPAQPTSECAGVLWPARPVRNHGIAGSIGAGLQKVGCGSCPLCSVSHDLAHAGCHQVGLDNVLDCVTPVVGISGFEGARGSKCAPRWGLAVSTTGQTGQSDAIPFAGGMRDSVVVKLTIPAVVSMAVVCSVAISCWPRVGPAYDVEPARERCTAEVPIMTLRAQVKGSGSDMSGKLTKKFKSDRAEGIAARADKRACIR